MDDYSTSTLTESKNEWVTRLINLLTPCVIVGLQSIFKESWQLCLENDEEDKYLMTFQNFLSRVPKWNPEIIKAEVDRIVQSSSCGYLEDLVTCVHVVQLKALTCIRVGQRQKKVDIDIPPINDFVHKVYIQVARKLYANIYLFEKDIPPLTVQKNNRELELIIKECILNAVRDSVPIEKLLRAYLDETEETGVVEEIKEEIISPKVEEGVDTIGTTITETANVETEVVKKNENMDLVRMPSIAVEKDNTPEENTLEAMNSPVTPQLEIKTDIMETKTTPSPSGGRSVETMSVPVIPSPTATQSPKNVKDENILQFSNTDAAIDTTGAHSIIAAPKNIERLERIADENAERRKTEEAMEESDENISIGENIKLDLTEVNDIGKPTVIKPPPEVAVQVLN